MAIVDRHGLPLSVSTHAANHHEVRLVQLCFDFYVIEAKPENLIGLLRPFVSGTSGSLDVAGQSCRGGPTRVPSSGKCRYPLHPWRLPALSKLQKLKS